MTDAEDEKVEGFWLEGLSCTSQVGLAVVQ